METRRVLDLDVAVADYADAIVWILARAARPDDRAWAVEAANTHVAALARTNEEFGMAMRQFDLICPDGMPLVWAVNRAARKASDRRLADRVYGPNLMLRTIEATSGHPQFRHFLLGGKPSTLAKLTTRFQQDHPHTIVAGSYSPPFGPWPDDEFDRIASHIRNANANLVWVGLGCPKQELWIARHKNQRPPAVYFGIGAAFAFHAGEVRQAPAWIQKAGMEWLYRLCAEPRRLWKRYFTYKSLFVYHLARDHFRHP
jgi:N-acetylglucosaminyldiphosphoundecaprenol N-acetyl-beta-D-mannosaminyltransferase